MKIDAESISARAKTLTVVPKEWSELGIELGETTGATTTGTTNYSLSFRMCRLKSLEGLSSGFDDHLKVGSGRGPPACLLLDLSVNEVSRLSDLSGLTALVELRLNVNFLSSLGPNLCPLTNLAVLNLASNRLVNLKGLETLVSLRKLDVGNNCLEVIDGLSSLVNLRQLILDDNKLVYLENLSSCSMLSHLSVAANTLTNASHLTFLPALTFLDLSDNCLADFEDVNRALRSLPSLSHVYMAGNPVAANPLYAMSVLEAPALTVLDNIVVTTIFRGQMEEAKKEKDAEALVTLATAAYHDKLASVQADRNMKVDALQARAQQVEESFAAYRKTMEGELARLVAYAQDVILKRGSELDIELLRSVLRDTEIARWQCVLEAVEADHKKWQAEARERRDALTYNQKLLELATVQPEVWRKIKAMEAQNRQGEDDYKSGVTAAEDVEATKKVAAVSRDRDARLRADIEPAHNRVAASLNEANREFTSEYRVMTLKEVEAERAAAARYNDEVIPKVEPRVLDGSMGHSANQESYYSDNDEGLTGRAHRNGRGEGAGDLDRSQGVLGGENDQIVSMELSAPTGGEEAASSTPTVGVAATGPPPSPPPPSDDKKKSRVCVVM